MKSKQFYIWIYDNKHMAKIDQKKLEISSEISKMNISSTDYLHVKSYKYFNRLQCAFSQLLHFQCIYWTLELVGITEKLSKSLYYLPCQCELFLYIYYLMLFKSDWEYQWWILIFCFLQSKFIFTHFFLSSKLSCEVLYGCDVYEYDNNTFIHAIVVQFVNLLW